MSLPRHSLQHSPPQPLPDSLKLDIQLRSTETHKRIRFSRRSRIISEGEHAEEVLEQSYCFLEEVDLEEVMRVEERVEMSSSERCIATLATEVESVVYEVGLLVVKSNGLRGKREEAYGPERTSATDFCLDSVAFSAARMTSAAPSLNRSRAADSMSYITQNYVSMCEEGKRSTNSHLISDVDVELLSIHSEEDVILAWRQHKGRA